MGEGRVAATRVSSSPQPQPQDEIAEHKAYGPEAPEGVEREDSAAAYAARVACSVRLFVCAGVADF